MKFASFDLEIAEELTETRQNNLGITVAAVICDGWTMPVNFYSAGRMSRAEACYVVERLTAYRAEGYTPLTWNGCKFDFRILAEESGLTRECADLALNHVDMMILVTFQKGFYLGLDTALKGMNIDSKVHTVTLKNGETLTEMTGQLAPSLWKAGEYEAVLEYIKGDVTQPLKLAHAIEHYGFIKWTTKTGRSASVSIPKLLTVKEAHAYPMPDTSWMTNPPSREYFYDWIPDLILKDLL